MRTLLDTADIQRLAEALATANYTRSGIAERFTAHTLSQAERGDFRELLSATDGRDRQATMVRLFYCRTTQPRDAVEAALAPLSLPAAIECGLLIAEGDGFRAGLRLELSGDQWLLSDAPATPGQGLPGDHVLGLAGAASSMAGYMLRRPVGSALDLGTGSGVLALELSSHASTVTGTDISQRALDFAATNAVLNGLEWELIAGDMTTPVQRRGFDQVVSNPPFIVGPGNGGYDYRDSGRTGDGVCAELAAAAPRLLNPGGTMQFMANWCHVKGQPWSERVAGWFEGAGCDVWAIQREVADPLDYVRFWERDAGDHDPRRLAEWLDWFDANDIEAVGFGVVNARYRAADEPSIMCEDLRQAPHGTFSDLISRWFDTAELLDSMEVEDLFAARLRLADGVKLHQEAVPGEQGWQVERQLLALSPRVEEIDPLLVSFLGGCDGSVELRTQARILAQAHEGDEALLLASLVPVVRDFIRTGYLTIVK